MDNQFEKAREVILKLKSAGYDAYFVGGYVRDYLLKIPSNDIDITTSATPKEVIALFSNVKETGKKYGSVTVLKGKEKYEVTTFRSDGRYLDNRHPNEVTFSKKITDDLARRDFTMNALIMDETKKISDYYHGIEDINKQMIRTINDPPKRFLEDALRMLRAFRFVSKLGFEIEENTLKALKNQKALIANISIERVMNELNKILSGNYRNKAINYLFETTVIDELYGLKSGFAYILKIKEKLTPLEGYIICNIFNSLDERLRFSNKDKRLITKITNLHEVTKIDQFNKLLVFTYGLEDCLLTNKINVLMGYQDQENLIKMLDKMLPIKDVCDLAFKGEDILKLTTLRKKSWISIIVDDLKYQVINGILDNEYQTLKNYALKKVDELILEMGDTNE